MDIKDSIVSKEHIDRILGFLVKKDIGDHDFMTIVQFLIASFDHPHRRRLLVDSKILKALFEIQIFKSADFEEANFYTKEARNAKQMLWCWTLQLAVVAFD